MIYVNNTFHGFYPVGTAAVVRAKSKQHAANLLNVALIKKGLEPMVEAKHMVEFTAENTALILHDGNY